jgi:photosystem II stability/assembly factor-like uncharacterized protein
MAGAFLVLAGGAVTDTGRAAIWTEIDSGLPATPVNISSIAIAPMQPTTIYARTFSADGVSGLFKTTDGGGHWKAISSVVGVGNLTVDPQNPSTVYVIGGRGLLKSTDGGDSWTGAFAGLPARYVNILAIDPVSPAKLYAVVGNSVFKSVDGAGSWNALDTGLSSNSFVSSLVIDPVDPSHIYGIAAVPQNNGPSLPALLESTDEGQTWNVNTNAFPRNSNVTSLTISSTAPSVLVAMGPVGPNGTGILKSTDGGDTWAAVNTGLPTGVGAGFLIIDPRNSSTFYLAINFFLAEAGGILKSTDGGASWNPIKPDLPANSPIDYLAIDPSGSGALYLLANNALFKSTDGGTRWNRTAGDLSAIEVATVAATPTDPAALYIGSGNAIFKSTDGGISWNSLFAFRLFAPTNPPPLVGSFFPDGSPTYPESMLVDPSNPNVLYVATGRGNGCYYADSLLYKSVDGGMTWDSSISPVTSGCILGSFFGSSAGLKAIDPGDPNTLYLAEADDGDGYWSLLKTTNGGADWKSVGDFPNNLQAGVWTLAIDPSTPSTLYAGVDDVPIYMDDGTIEPGAGGVFKSTDGGATWNSVGLSGAAVTLLVIDPTQPNVLYAATAGDYGAPYGFRGFFKSTDYGATWSSINNGLDSLFATGTNVSAIVIDPGNPNVLYAGSRGNGVFKSSDGGSNWVPFSDGLANLDIRALAVAADSAHTLYAGTSGGLFKAGTSSSGAVMMSRNVAKH